MLRHGRAKGHTTAAQLVRGRDEIQNWAVWLSVVFSQASESTASLSGLSMPLQVLLWALPIIGTKSPLRNMEQVTRRVETVPTSTVFPLQTSGLLSAPPSGLGDSHHVP